MLFLLELKWRVINLMIQARLSKYKYEILLSIVFLFALAFQLYFSLQTPYFSDGDAYFTIRQIDHIKEFGTPMLYDELSYGGKPSMHLPLFSYIMVLFSYIPYGLKVVPAIFICSIVFLIYFITLRLCNDKFTALAAALMSAFVPVVMSSTLNNISVFSLVIPLMLLMFYSFVNLMSKPYLYTFIVLSFVLPLLHPIAIFFAISLIIFYVLVLAEDIEISRLSKEAMVFSIFLTLLIEFLFFKRAFLSLGFQFVWQNIPSEILANYFKNLNLIDSILELGILPVLFGIMGLTVGFFRDKTIGVFLGISASFSALILLSLKLVNFSVGLMFFSIPLVIGSALVFSKFFKYLRLTKFSRFDNLFRFALVILLLGVMVSSSFFASRDVINNSLTKDEYLILRSIYDETEKDSTVVSLFSEGYYISGIGNRKNVMDTDFLTSPSVNMRYNDVGEIFTSVSEVKALQLLEKYSVDYIYLTPSARRFYNVQNLSYVEDDKCFVEYRKSGEVYLYKVRC
jgi:hypothetical protein